MWVNWLNNNESDPSRQALTDDAKINDGVVKEFSKKKKTVNSFLESVFCLAFCIKTRKEMQQVMEKKLLESAPEEVKGQDFEGRWIKRLGWWVVSFCYACEKRLILQQIEVFLVRKIDFFFFVSVWESMRVNFPFHRTSQQSPFHFLAQLLL